MTARDDDRRDRLSDVFLDEDTIPRGAIDADHERAVAIFDLVEENTFAIPGRDDGPYTMTISQEESKPAWNASNAWRFDDASPPASLPEMPEAPRGLGALANTPTLLAFCRV